MRKTDKKIDNQIRQALTRVCDQASEQINGFLWITHTVNYPNMAATLKITCVFDTNQSLNRFQQSASHLLLKAIKAELNALSLKELTPILSTLTKRIQYDSEQNCLLQHQGNWAARLA